MKRSSHIAVKVPKEKLEEASTHYKAVLELEEKSRTESGIELKGENFTLWVDASSAAPIGMQEFVPASVDSSRAIHEANGCEIFDESEFGFHVRDPYGLSYHVWTSTDSPE